MKYRIVELKTMGTIKYRIEKNSRGFLGTWQPLYSIFDWACTFDTLEEADVYLEHLKPEYNVSKVVKEMEF